MQNGEKYCDNNLKEKNDGPIKEKEEFPSCLQKYVDKIIAKEGYIHHKVYNRMISTEGGNYLGVLYEVDIDGQTADGEKGTNIFVKNIIAADNFTMLSVTEVYLKECFAYTKLFKIFTELQNEAGIPTEEKFKTVKCFYADSDAIFLENMTKKGFKTLHRMDIMPLKFAELSVQQLAKFHGLSFVLQKRRPEYFNHKLKTMKTSLNFKEEMDKFLSSMFDISTKYLEESQQKKISKLIPTLKQKYQQYFQEITWGCICHSDYRQNNILMKEIDGEVTEVIPIDYQLLHYGCPLNDFFYLVFCGSDQEFRRKHLTHLKNMYYDTLEQFLKYFDMDVEFVFPRKEFERYFEERLDYGLILSFTMMSFLFVKDDNVPDLGSDDLANREYHFDNRYQERLLGIVDDFERWGYL